MSKDMENLHTKLQKIRHSEMLSDKLAITNCNN